MNRLQAHDEKIREAVQSRSQRANVPMNDGRKSVLKYAAVALLATQFLSGCGATEDTQISSVHTVGDDKKGAAGNDGGAIEMSGGFGGEAGSMNNIAGKSGAGQAGKSGMAGVAGAAGKAGMGGVAGTAGSAGKAGEAGAGGNTCENVDILTMDIQPEELDVSKGESLTINITAFTKQQIDLIIRKFSNNDLSDPNNVATKIDTLTENQIINPGSYNYVWNGTDSSGNLMGEGLYDAVAMPQSLNPDECAFAHTMYFNIKNSGQAGAGGSAGSGGSPIETCDRNTWMPTPNPDYPLSNPQAATQYFEEICPKWQEKADEMNAKCQGMTVNGMEFYSQAPEIFCMDASIAWLCSSVGSADWNQWIEQVKDKSIECHAIFYEAI